jgi:hypothetical protein
MKLQRKFTKNSYDTGEVKSRVDSAKKISDDAHQKAQNVSVIFLKILNYFLFLRNILAERTVQECQ